MLHNFCSEDTTSSALIYFPNVICRIVYFSTVLTVHNKCYLQNAYFNYDFEKLFFFFFKIIISKIIDSKSEKRCRLILITVPIYFVKKNIVIWLSTETV